MNADNETLRELKRAHIALRERMSNLWQQKHDLLGLFRTRLEEEKLVEIKTKLTRMSQPNDSLHPNRHF